MGSAVGTTAVVGGVALAGAATGRAAHALARSDQWPTCGPAADGATIGSVGTRISSSCNVRRLATFGYEPLSVVPYPGACRAVRSTCTAR
jgi:hypothetical protein